MVAGDNCGLVGSALRTTNPTEHATITGMSRFKVSLTLDSDLVAALDGFAQLHPGQNRSKVINLAPQQWCAQQQNIAMETQYAGTEDDVMRAERKAWRAIRRSAAPHSTVADQNDRGRPAAPRVRPSSRTPS